MMNTLFDLIASSPNCRITICSSKPRRVSRSGDVKILKRKGRMVRRQATYQGCGMVRRGRTVWEWITTERDIEENPWYYNVDGTPKEEHFRIIKTT